ncbi:MAG: hypothetical protein BWY98_00203 [Tenericutes bacterium ADurb.BinA155]|jgi:hypothetical protein|nr:MAG: hypothetical protein BWY98_00203 [Tenericutes bacterium ADurb.BinA155]
MEEKTARALNELRLALDQDPRILRLNALEAELQKDEGVRVLSQKKDEAEAAYNDCIAHHNETSPEAKTLQKKLYEAKLALDQNPKVQDYNAAYIVVRDLYMQIDDLLFHDFRIPNACEAKK